MSLKDQSILFTKQDLERIKEGKTEEDKQMATVLEEDLTDFLFECGQYKQAMQDRKEASK